MTAHVRLLIGTVILALSGGLLSAPAQAQPPDPLLPLIAELDAAQQAEGAIGQIAVTWKDSGRRTLGGVGLWVSAETVGSFWRNRAGEWAQEMTREYAAADSPRETRKTATGYACVQKCASSAPQLQAWARVAHKGRALQGMLTQDPEIPGPTPHWGDPPLLPSGVAKALMESIVAEEAALSTTITETALEDGRRLTTVESTSATLEFKASLTWESARVVRMTYEIAESGMYSQSLASGFYQTENYSDRSPVVKDPARMLLFTDVVDKRLRAQARALAQDTISVLTRKAAGSKRAITAAWVDRQLDSAMTRAASALGNPGFETLAGVHPLSRIGAPRLLIAALPDVDYWPSGTTDAELAYSPEIIITADGALKVGQVRSDEIFIPEVAEEPVAPPAPESLLHRILGEAR